MNNAQRMDVAQNVVQSIHNIGSTIGTNVDCPRAQCELLYNASFDCGDRGWGFDPSYPAVVTDNGDGSLHLKSESSFGSLVPHLPTSFPWDTYIIECEVANIVGTGKMSLRRLNNTWYNSPDITTNGVHTFEYTGNIKEIHVGANGDTNFEADYKYISLRLKTCTPTTPP
jgi:hypothetical protein